MSYQLKNETKVLEFKCPPRKNTWQDRQRINVLIDAINNELTWSQFIKYRNIQGGDLRYIIKIESIRLVTRSKKVLDLLLELENHLINMGVIKS